MRGTTIATVILLLLGLCSSVFWFHEESNEEDSSRVRPPAPSGEESVGFVRDSGLDYFSVQLLEETGEPFSATEETTACAIVAGGDAEFPGRLLPSGRPVFPELRFEQFLGLECTIKVQSLERVPLLVQAVVGRKVHAYHVCKFAKFQGDIVDVTGGAVENAVVRLTASESLVRRVSGLRDLLTPELRRTLPVCQVAVGAARTDGTGVRRSFVFDALMPCQPGESYWLEVMSPGYGRVSLPRLFLPPGETTKTVSIGSGGSLEIYLVESTGQLASGDFQVWISHEETHDGAVVVGEESRLRNPNEDGAYSFHGLREGIKLVNVGGRREDGSIVRRLVELGSLGLGEDQTVEVSLDSGVIFEGEVRDPAGDPVLGAMIRAVHEDGIRILHGRSDENGSFRFVGVDEGSYMVVVRPSNAELGRLQSLRTQLRLDQGVTRRSFQLVEHGSPPTGKRRVLAKFARGDASESSRPERPHRWFALLDGRLIGVKRSWETEAAFVFPVELAGDLQVAVRIDDGWASSRVERMQPGSAEITVQLLGDGPPRTIVGRLVDSSAKGIPAVRIELRDPGSRWGDLGSKGLDRVSTVSAPDGGFILEGAPPSGRFEVVAFISGAPYDLDVVIMRGADVDLGEFVIDQ